MTEERVQQSARRCVGSCRSRPGATPAPHPLLRHTQPPSPSPSALPAAGTDARRGGALGTGRERTRRREVVALRLRLGAPPVRAPPRKELTDVLVLVLVLVYA